MKRICNGFWMSLSLFSILPAPMVWEKKSLCLIIPFFPVVGAILGGLWYLVSEALRYVEAPLMLTAGVLAVAFPLFSGFIHMDGFMDTADAVFSRADQEKKRKILKDPHPGAFGVIALGVYLLLSTCSMYSILEDGENPGYLFVLIPVLSRSLAGCVILNARLMSDQGYAAQFRQGANRSHTGILIMIMLCCFGAAFLGKSGTIVFVLMVLTVIELTCGFWAVSQLGGVNGDVSGFMVTAGELSALIALSLC